MKTISLSEASPQNGTRNSARLRILHVIYSLSLQHGGPPEGLRQLAEAYRQEGVHLEVASLDGPEEPFLEELPFKVHAFGPVKTVYGYSPRLLPWLRDHVTAYDAVVIHGIWQYNSLAAWRAARDRVPYAIFVHGALDPWFKEHYPLKHIKKILYWRSFQYPVLRDARAVLFTSQTEKEQAVLSFRPNRWNGLVIPYGTNPPAGDPAAQIEAFFSLCPRVRDRRFLLFMGRLHEKKGCDLLLDAFSQIADSAPGLDLVMAGPDQVGWKAALEKQAVRLGIQERVHWPGLLQKAPKWGAFRASEALVLPSHQENFGIAVAEALACGKPALISDQVNIWHEVEEDGAALVAPDTVEGTLSLLTRWLALPDGRRAVMSQRAAACFAARYSMRGAAAAIASIFQPEMSRQPGRKETKHPI